MGLRTNALLDESFSKNSHPLGEEGCKLRGDASTRLRIHLLVSGSGFGIGSKLYDRKNALVAAEILNGRVIPFFEQEGVPVLRILTDRGTEYCGAREHHEFQLYLALENIDHTKTKAKSPQTSGICERFHKTGCKSSTKSHLERICTNRSSCFKKMSINGSDSITKNALTADATVSEKLQDKPLKNRSSWPDKKCSTNSYNPVHNLGNSCQIKYWLLHFTRRPFNDWSERLFALRVRCGPNAACWMEQ
jgi:hypothetical protein